MVDDKDHTKVKRKVFLEYAPLDVSKDENNTMSLTHGNDGFENTKLSSARERKQQLSIVEIIEAVTPV